MGGEILNRLEAAEHGSAQRQARLAAIERGAQVPVLTATATLALVAWRLSGWAIWPWAGGLGALGVLALVGIPRRLGVAYTVAAALVVVDVWFLLLVEPWWWGLLAGLTLTGAGVLAVVKLR